MASPFHWFRKRQKLLLGVFGVALIFVFTISLGTGTDPLVDLLSGNRPTSSGPQAVAVTWQGGKLREGDLENLRAQRALVRQYLAVLSQTAMEQGGQPQENVFSQDISDRALLEAQLLQQIAAEMGISVTDEGIKDYLVSLTDDRLREWQMNEIWQNLTGGNYSDVQLFGMLRRELVAHRVREFLISSGDTISPVQIWDQFNRLERRVHVEMLPIEVDSFLDQVSEPEETELRDFFERYKTNVANPMNPTPGFFQRERRAFEYIKFDFGAFLESEAQRVSADAVREYYEGNRDDFIQTKLPASDLDLPQGETSAEPTADAEVADESQMEDAAPVPSPPREAADGAGSAPAENLGESDEPGRPQEEESPPAESALDDPQMTATEGSPASGGEEENGERSSAATGDEDMDDGAPEERPTPKNEDEVENGSSSAAGEEETNEQGEPEFPQATTSPWPQQTGTASADSSTVPSPEESVETESAAADSAAVADVPTSDSTGRYRPLDEVSDEIRRILAMPSARQRMDQAMAKTRQRLIPYLQWHTAPGRDDDSGPPPEVDLAAISVDPPLSMDTVPLSDEVDIETYEIGQAFDITTRNEQVVTVPFAQVAFRRDFQPYQTASIPMSSGNWPQYLFWVTAIEEAYVPSLEEVRDEVVLAWKRQKAFDLAVDDALNVVEKARDNPRQRLQEICTEPGRKFYDETNVRWLSTGNVPATGGTMPWPTQIPSVPGTTEEMLRTIFRMKPGEVEMVSNADKTQVFVVRYVGDAPSQDVRRNIFLRGAGVPQEIQGARQLEFRMAWQLAYMNLLEEAQVDWQRSPREAR